jgi:uncharacterized protein (DUF885 family)
LFSAKDGFQRMKFRGACIIFLCSLVVLCGAARAQAPGAVKLRDNAARLGNIAARYDAWLTKTDPVAAAARGDRDAASRWPDDAPAAIAARMAELRGIDSDLRRVDPAGLSDDETLTARLLRWQIETALDGDAFDEARIPFTSDEGFFVTPLYAADGTVLRDGADARAWLNRLRALPAYFATETDNLRRGIATGFVQPRRTAQTAARLTRGAAAVPAEQDPLLHPFDTLPPTLPIAQREAWRAQGLSIIRQTVKPAERRLADFFEQVYVPHARDSLGAGALPGGAAYYAYLVRRETTTSLTPDQIFAIGQAEIRRIRAAMTKQIAASGFTGDFAAFQAMLRRDPRFYAASREALLEKASRLAKSVDGQLPRFFGKLPRLSYGVRAVPPDIEEGYTSARYFPGSPVLGVAGGLMINTSHLDQRPLYELPALVAHEGAPGHHIQIALAQELTGLPTFRQDSAITAFVEGWAVYAEQLAAEMGLYETPYERFGMLSMEMWRACRLVMDVGLHAKGFSRDQALQCLRDNTALSEKNMQTEVDRYIAWPGQALGYKIGELKIMELRHRAEAALGTRFDLRAFHDEILDEGAMPLNVLEDRVNDWIARQLRN